MPISPSDRASLRKLYANLADNALQPDSEFYEPVYERLGLEDPVAQIFTLIDFDGVESIRLFSGFRGSGKTTELHRLQRVLEGRGYFVLYADTLNYVNAAEPIEITDPLMAMAGAFSDALEEKLDKDIGRETFWDRIWTFLNTEINLKEAGAKLGYETPGKELFGSVKTGVDLKFELKSATNFRRELQGFLANKLKELKNNVDRFFEYGIKEVRKARGEDTQVVFIFDQLEQLRGTLQTEQDVIRSVERIFAVHIDLLKIPYVHAVLAAVAQIRAAWNCADHPAVHRAPVEQRPRAHPLRTGLEGLPFPRGPQAWQGGFSAAFWKTSVGAKADRRRDRRLRRAFPRSAALVAGHGGARAVVTEPSGPGQCDRQRNQRRA